MTASPRVTARPESFRVPGSPRGSSRGGVQDSRRGQYSPRNVTPFSPGGTAPLRPTSAIRPDGIQSPRRSFMGPCQPSARRPSTPKVTVTAQPEVATYKKKPRDPHWQSTNEVLHINFVKRGMVKHLRQFDIPEIPEGELPPLTPQQRERELLERRPDQLAVELKNRVYLSDIFNAKPPPPGYFPNDGFLQAAEPNQEMLPGDNRPRWRNC